MGYVRKYAKKAYRSQAVRKRVNIYGKAGLQLYKDVKYIKGLINSEPHQHVVQSSSNFSYTGDMISLSSIPTGDNYNNRTGNRVLPRYLSINCTVGGTTTLAAATAGTRETIRVIVLRSWIDNGTTAGSLSPSEVLETTGSSYAPLSHLNEAITGPKRDRNRRIEVLRNELFVVDNMGTNFTHTYQWNIQMNGGNIKEHIEFPDSATSEPNSGGIYIMFISDSSLSTEAQYQLESKLTYYDN